MPEEKEETVVQGQEQTDDAIEALKKLKRNSVSKTEYEKVVAEKKQLLEAFINGDEIEVPHDEAKPTIEELKKNLQQEDLNNLEYAKAALALRNAVIEAGGVDPFLPQGFKITASHEDEEAAQRVAEVLQDCIDRADGDSNIFTAELQRRTIDVSPVRPKKK